MKARLARWVLLGAVAMAPLAQAQAQDCPSPLRFADTGIEGAEELQRAYSGFASLLSERLGSEVTFFPVGNRTTAVNALRFRQLDVVLAGPSEYVLMSERVRGIQPVAAIERPEYYPVFVVRADSPLQTLADLRGRHVAMKDHGSTTGHILPTLMLHEAGFDLDRDLRVTLLGGARMEALASGGVDAVGTGIRDVAPYLARHGAESLRVLARGPDAPGDPFVAGAHLGPACVARLKRVLIDNADDVLDAILGSGRRDKYTEARVVPVDDTGYAGIRTAYGLLGLGRGR